ncbi:proline-rich acidic protein 1 [Lissotriton helveticus]
MKRITSVVSCLLLLQFMEAMSAMPQFPRETGSSFVMDSKGGPGDIQIEPPEDAEITYDIDPQMLIFTNALQKGKAEDPFAHLRSVSEEAEEDRDSLYHPFVEGDGEAYAAQVELVYSQVVNVPEEDRDHLHHH